jgi:small conductance mechanosensitive channel
MQRLSSFIRRGLLFLWLACLVTPVGAAWAQEAAPADAAPSATESAPPPATIDVEQLEALVGTIEDPAAREKFLKDLKAVIAAQKAVEPKPEEGLVDLPPPETLGARVIFAISAGIRSLSENIMEGVSVVQDLPAAGHWLHDQLSRRDTRNFWLGLVAKLVLVVLGGYVAERIMRRLLARPGRRLEASQPPHLTWRVLLAIGRVALDLLPIVAFAAVAYLLLPFAGTGDRARFVVLAVVNSHILVCLTLVAARLLLMPSASSLRLTRLNDETAAYLYIWTRRLAVIVIYGYFLAEVVMILGADIGVKAFILKLVGLITVAMLIVLVLQNRKIMSDWLRGRAAADEAVGQPGAFGVFRRRLADVWHVLVSLYLVAFYVVWVLNIGFVFLLRATVLTIVVLLLARLLIIASTQVVERAFRVGHDLTLRFPGLEARANRYLPALGRVLRLLIYVVAGLLILQAWGVESLAWLTSRSGVRFIGTALGILVVLAIALILWEMISLALDRYGARIDATSRSSARVRTLLPLVRTVTMVVLTVMVGLVVLSQIGINITPLLAGAGVIGLAVGFGSQKLVQDVINGLFILAEDTISVGDVVNLDGRGGLVESMTIRYIRMRDFDGSVWTIPFSEVKAVLNMTKDYSRYVFNVEIAYKEDVDKVVEVLKQLGDEMQKDPAYASLILEPIEVVGLDSFGASSMVIKARITTLPIKQWTVGREFNRRLKKRFDELGIEIPFPTRTIYYGREKDVPVYQDQATLQETPKGMPEVRTLSGASPEAAD